MRYYFTLCLFIGLNSFLLAQPNITRLEYFFDTDPGFGAGINVPITPGQNLTDVQFNVPLNSITEGFHMLYVRSKSSNGWSRSHNMLIYKIPALVTVNNPLPNLKRLEYFIDTDPGYGNGVSVPFTPATKIEDLAFSINVQGLSETEHKLYLRAQDQNGKWSIVNIRTFNVCNIPAPTATPATNILNTSFTANWNEVTGATGYLLDVSTDNFATFVSGYNARSVATTSQSVTGLIQATQYQYRVRAIVGCTTFSSNVITVTTLATTPTASPSGLTFSNPAPTSFNVSFTAASGAPTGYLVVRKAGSASTFIPQTNLNYTAGQNIGDGIIVQKSSLTSFAQTGLPSATLWFFTIYSYNEVNGQISYRTTSPLTGNYYTQAVEPTAQPTNLAFTNVTNTSLTVTYAAATGNPTGYIVFRRTGAAPTFVPVDATTYTVNTNYGDSRAVYIGPNTTFNETGLTANTNYQYAVYAYNGSGLPINYRTVSPLTGSITTAITPPTAQPTNLTFSNVTSNSLTGTFTAASGSPAGYLVLRKVGAYTDFVPVVNTAYTSDQQVEPGTFVAHVGSATTFNNSGLVASTTYHYTIFSYNQSGSLISYRTISPLQNTVTTFTAAPTAQPGNITFSNITATGMRVNFTAASPAPSGYLGIRRANTAPTFTPVAGTEYTIGQTLADGSVVVHRSNATTFDVSGLLPGTVYHYVLFSYNGSGTATNYITNVSATNSASKITLPAKPNVLSATTILQTGFTARWEAVTGATNYRLDVSQNNFASMVAGFDNLTVTGTSQPVTGLQPGVAYKYRVRAVNESGLSENSDEMQQFTIPATPAPGATSNATQTSFTASWSSVSGATGYFLDVSDDNYTSFAPGFQNFAATGTSATVTGLSPGRVYKFRVRSANSGGASPSSASGEQLLVPATPSGLFASNETSSTFIAKWTPAEGAAEYRLDVTLGDDNFSPSLSGYTNKPIIGATEEIITGLTANTVYRFRVRAVNATGTSPNSSPSSVSTLSGNVGGTLQLSPLSFNPVVTTGANTKVNVEILAGTGPFTAAFFHRGITKSTFIAATPVAVSGTLYEATLTADMMDELGVEFYYRVTDGNGQSRESAVGRIFKTIPSEGIRIPFSRFGGTLESYELFSIPYRLNDNLIESIFKAMGSYDKTRWRLVRFQDNRNVDYGAGLNRIEVGKGYWFNRKDRTEVFLEGGSLEPLHQDNPFKMRLEHGWNQIGNPFPFEIKWSEVLAENNNPAAVGELKMYQHTSQQLVNNDRLPMWAGGFVHNDSNSPIELVMPVSLSPGSGGRTKSTAERIVGSNPDGEEWVLPITVRQAGIETQSAVGMHPQASESKDWYDDLIPPRWGPVLELYTHREEFFYPYFQRDIVPTQSEYTWNLTLESSSNGIIELHWNSTPLLQAQAQLFLYDEIEGRLIDMKQSNRYTLAEHSKKELKLIYTMEGDFIPNRTVMGKPYPNPASSSVNIPIVLGKEAEAFHMRIDIFDLKGVRIKSMDKVLSSGFYEALWDGTDETGHAAANGVYIVKLMVNNRYLAQHAKLVLKRNK
ncbi:MAG: fibronectin type III domain-containing protein [Cyclobacteriaceae bacterium]|nr:fibronectin type III domain-containing protein [Cyclobacteriaceae bacterium]